jgi:hypothetical protein
VEIRKNATAIKAVNTQITQVNARVTEVNSRLGGRIDTVAAVNTRQNKAIASVRRQQESLQQGLMFSALLGGGTRTLEVQEAVGSITSGTKIKVKDAGDKFERLLPVLLSSGGLGGSQNGAQGGGGGLFSNPLMLILLLDK